LFLAFRLPAIASRSGEAGGDESKKIQSPSAKKLLPLN
jgi:hypothetical protein